MPSLSLGGLLAPYAEEVFLTQILGNRYLHVEGSPTKFSGLLSWGGLNEILSTRALTDPQLRLFQHGVELPAECFMRNSLGSREVSVADVTMLLRDGAEVAIGGLDRVYVPVSKLCQVIERSIEVPVSASVCASFGEVSQSKLNWEPSDRFLLQIEGEAAWRIHEPTFRYPVSTSIPSAPNEEPVRHVSLRKGDLLYLPRGWWHVLDSASGPCCRVALDFRSPTGVDIVDWLAHSMKQREEVRMDFPRFGDQEAQADYFTRLRIALLEAWGQPGLFIGYLRELQAKQPPRNVFALPWTAGPISQASADLTIRSMIRFDERIEALEHTESIELCHDGKRSRFHAATRPLFETLFCESTIRLSEFLERFHGEFDEDQLRTFLTDLIKLGAVAVHDTTPEH